MSFVLDNDTILRGYLTHIQSNVRRMARLIGEHALHPDHTAENAPKMSPKMAELWAILERDIPKVLPDLHLVPFSQLASSRFPWGEQDCGFQAGTRDPTRITFSQLKARADKARRKDPTITLLKSWSLEEHERDKG
jgi:hypothetical protein